MASWAIVQDNKIVNLIIADNKEIAEQVTGLQAIDDEGWICIGFEKYENSWRPPYPNDGLEYYWNQSSKSWVVVNPVIIEE